MGVWDAQLAMVSVRAEEGIGESWRYERSRLERRETVVCIIYSTHAILNEKKAQLWRNGVSVCPQHPRVQAASLGARLPPRGGDGDLRGLCLCHTFPDQR